MADLVPAIAHHLVVFGIAAVLAAELALMRPAAMSPHTVRLPGRFDAACWHRHPCRRLRPGPHCWPESTCWH